MSSRPGRFTAFAVACALPFALACGPHTNEPTTTAGASRALADDANGAWSEMVRVLVGRWRATTPEKRTIEVAYRVVSNGSALVETFTSSSGKETMTVYHRDGRALMLTHYCAQGNQARLKATETTGSKIVFTFLDATNVQPDQGIMQKLAFSLHGDSFDLETVYREPSGEPDATTLRFERQP
jgi:hypothetical protein